MTQLSLVYGWNFNVPGINWWSLSHHIYLEGENFHELVRRAGRSFEQGRLTLDDINLELINTADADEIVVQDVEIAPHRNALWLSTSWWLRHHYAATRGEWTLRPKQA